MRTLLESMRARLVCSVPDRPTCNFYSAKTETDITKSRQSNLCPWASTEDDQASGEASRPTKARQKQPARQTIGTIHFFNTVFFFKFFLWVIFGHFDPDPVDQNQCGSMEIRIHNIAFFCIYRCPKLQKQQLNIGCQLLFINFVLYKRGCSNESRKSHVAKTFKV